MDTRPPLRTNAGRVVKLLDVDQGWWVSPVSTPYQNPPLERRFNNARTKRSTSLRLAVQFN
jgi:hypothetical protein